MPAVAPELGVEGLIPYRAHAYREALATSTPSATTMVVHSSRDTIMSFPEHRRQRVHLGMGHTVQWIMCTRADYHGALWKESLRDIFSHGLGRVLKRFAPRSIVE